MPAIINVESATHDHFLPKALPFAKDSRIEAASGPTCFS